MESKFIKKVILCSSLPHSFYVAACHSGGNELRHVDTN